MSLTESDLEVYFPKFDGMKEKDIYKLVYETVTEAIIVADRSGTIIDANPSAAKMFEYPLEVLVGMKVDELLPEAFRKIHQTHRENYVHGPTRRPMGKGMDLWAQCASGRLIPVEISLNHAETEGMLRVVALISDISARKKTEERILQINKELEDGVQQRTVELDNAIRALEDSQHLYSLIAHNFPDGTINVLDRDLRYVFAEGMEYVRYGTDNAKIIGSEYLATLRAEDVDIARSELEKSLRGASRTFELTKRNNTYIVNAVPLLDLGNEVSRVLLVEKNISEQKQAERDMINALNKERELNELKSRFVSMASHEFRTPLATILSSVNLVNRYIETGSSEGVDKHVNRIRTSVQNLTSILNDFLSLEKLELGKMQCRPAPFDLFELGQSVKEEIGSMAKIGQHIDLKCTGNGIVQLDSQLLRNILLNLLSNAIKYSPEHARVAFSIAVNDQVTITVADEGMGIPASEQQHLFERFFRANNVTNTQGTGLGLHIVRKHLDLMHGSITFDSQIDQGTTFVISMPALLEPTE